MEWFKISSEEAINRLKSSIQGLSTQEALLRLDKYGKNALPRGKKFGPWLFRLEQIKSPLVFILLIAGFITLAIKQYVDTAVILASVAVNMGIGFYQEYSSSKVLEHLQKLIKVNARVQRDGQILEIDSENLVPGDVVQLKAGMKIPADIRLLKVKELAIGEAVLTGESNPVEKITKLQSGDLAIGDRKNMAFMGTTVDKGEGLGLVVATGAHTEIGKIAELTKKADKETTPLQERLSRLGKIIALIVAISAVLIVIVGVLEKLDFVEIFITAVAVAVAAVPEGLPAALAVILAVSSKKISKTGGLVKKLIAAESLGSTSVICVDKTGTLTEGKMKVEKLLTQVAEEKLLTALAFANEAILEKKDDGTYEIKGESTDYAKLQAFLDAGLSYQQTLEAMPLLALVPFDAENKFIASFHKLNDRQVILYVTGAPEVFDAENLTEQYESLASQGFRIIGAGYKVIDEKPNEFPNKKEKELISYIQELTFLGLAAIRDPIRSDVKEIMSEVKSAGLKVVITTGDHLLTAVAIGKELGLVRDEKAVMEGFQLDKLSDEELKNIIKDIDIFARVDPVHKLRIVKAWKDIGESVAATGDGINDAPALKTADVGIAMASGADITKEAADLVLMNDSFVTIVQAIRQGRTAFYNIKKVTIFLLANSFTELILILSALLLHIPLPLTALQILWINLVNDALPNFALAFEGSEGNVMKRKPIQRKSPLLDSMSKVLIFPVSITTDLVILSIFLFLLTKTDYSIDYIRTFIFAVLGTAALFYIFALRTLDRSIFQIHPFKNSFLVLAIAFGFLMMGLAMYLPAMNQVLDTEPLLPHHMLWIVLLGFYEIALVEIVKWFYNRKPKIYPA